MLGNRQKCFGGKTFYAYCERGRRVDSDFLLLKGVLENIDPGEVVEIESHFDRFRPGEEINQKL